MTKNGVLYNLVVTSSKNKDTVWEKSSPRYEAKGSCPLESSPPLTLLHLCLAQSKVRVYSRKHVLTIKRALFYYFSCDDQAKDLFLSQMRLNDRTCTLRKNVVFVASCNATGGRLKYTVL